MNGRERGFLLLTSHLGNPNRKPLSAPQLRNLADRMSQFSVSLEDRDLSSRDLVKLGYGWDMAERIVALLEEEDLLDTYLQRGNRAGCVPITRVSNGYPLILRKRLGLDSPGCLWAKGDISILNIPAISLVGSRDLLDSNGEFAEEVGRQAALQGLTHGVTTDLLSEDIRQVIYHLGTITGEISSDDILKSIFANFCIGK